MPLMSLRKKAWSVLLHKDTPKNTEYHFPKYKPNPFVCVTFPVTVAHPRGKLFMESTHEFTMAAPCLLSWKTQLQAL